MSKTAEDWGWEVYVAFTARDMQRGCDLIGKAMAEERAAALEEAALLLEDHARAYPEPSARQTRDVLLSDANTIRALAQSQSPREPEPRVECWRCRLPLDEERVCSASGFSLLCAPPPERKEDEP